MCSEPPFARGITWSTPTFEPEQVTAPAPSAGILVSRLPVADGLYGVGFDVQRGLKFLDEAFAEGSQGMA